ncbi:MAG: class I SAM-dependent methyltransferase [bacterium]
MDDDLYQEWFELESYHWWFVGRRALFVRLIEDTLRAHTARTEGVFRVADMGCGTGVNLDALSRFGRVVGVDLAPTALAFCRERKPYLLCRAPFTALPFRSGSIHLVTAFDVLEHGEDDRAMLREAYRVCAPGGWAAFSVPAYRFMWGDHDVAAHHYRRYAAAEILGKLQEAGFRVRRMTYLNSLLFPVSIVFRHGKNLLTGLLRGLGLQVKPRSDFRSTAPALLNGALLRIFLAEYHILKRVNLPFGLSIFCMAQKV